MSGDLSYAGAGVDIDAADDAIERLKPHVRSTFRPEVLSDIGSFGSLVAIPKGYDEPILVSGNDGAGTKTAVASAVGRYDTIGIDVVAMCVDDIVTMGAEPLFFLDQITVGSIDPARIEELVIGFAEGCRQAGCALTGGEIAEHPDLMGAADFDLAGFAVGVVERSRIIDGQAVVPGDVIVGLASPGLRCNGYSLARRVLMAPRWARNCCALRSSTPQHCAACSTTSTSMPQPTSPVAACLAMLFVCSVPVPTRSLNAVRGMFLGSSPRSLHVARSRRSKWRRCSTSESAWLSLCHQMRLPPQSI
jgi:phosphoribosylaminoimidazole synthetase